MRATHLVAVLSCAIFPAVVFSDSGISVQARTYTSANGEYSLTVDPRWTEKPRRTNPLLTLRRAAGEIVWERTPEGFVDFDYPMHACVSNDGRFVVFGGYSAHNYKDYNEGLRFYNVTGSLIRMISRLDLPPGQYGVSTAAWYDEERSRIEDKVFLFFTPAAAEPLRFDVETGEVLEGTLVPGQGDDEKGFMEGYRQMSEDA